jgi:hypothetical protein
MAHVRAFAAWLTTRLCRDGIAIVPGMEAYRDDSESMSKESSGLAVSVRRGAAG